MVRDSKPEESLAERAELADSQLELDRLKLLAEWSESSKRERHQFWSISVPILAATLAISGSIIATLITIDSEKDLATDEFLVSERMATDAAEHEFNMMIMDAVHRYHDMSTEMGQKNTQSARLMCLHWGSSYLSARTSNILQTIIDRDKLCGSDGGGFPELIILGGDDPDRRVKESCISARWIEDTARANDQAGFHGVPNGRDGLSLQAADGHFLGPYEIVSESYRNNTGAPLREQLDRNVKIDSVEGRAFPTAYSATIRCTNSRGSGRTCSSSAVVRAKEFPNMCSKFFGAS